MEAKHIKRVFGEHRWILTTRQALDAGVHPVQLYSLAQSGRVERLKRGLFRWAGAPFDEKYSLIVAHREVPDGVVCLLSALQFHDLTTQAPFEVWVTVKRGTAVPDNPAVPLRVFRSSGPAYREGVERHRLKGVTIKVYSVAKTIADCFKYRNRIGLDVALEALREGWQKRRFRVDELMHYARVCRVANIIRPYAEVVIQEWGRRTNPADKRD